MPPKRKRPDRPSGDGGRPSPHRPSETPMGQHDRDDGQGRGRGRGPRGPGRRDSSQSHSRPPSQHQQNPPTGPRPSSAASQAPPPPPPPALVSRPPTQPVQRPTSPVRSNYRYDNLTDEKISTWAERGRDEILRHGKQSRDDVDITELSSLFQEFIHAAVQTRLSPADAGACVKEIIGDETTEIIKDSYAFAPHSLFLDSLAIVMDNEPHIYRPSLREFLIVTGVSPALMRQVLDAQILQQLGLIRDSFSRLGIRAATNLLYRQANYNLLREETEGYSKLITELFTTSSVTPPPPELAEQTFERVKALIGTFDLDVGRVLDVTLDVAAAVLIKQFKFFVKFLRISSWWPRSHLKFSTPIYVGGLPMWAQPGYPQWLTAEEDEEILAGKKLARDTAFWNRAREVSLAAFFELGGRQVAESDTKQLSITNGSSGEDIMADFERQWVQETNTLLPPGNRTAAQLLGFKLRFYNSDSREATDVLPANLLYLAALLIKIGFISLVDLYPHLSPADEDMEQVRDKELKRVQEEELTSRGGAMNALLMAGVLPQGDDDNPAVANLPRREPSKKAEPESKEAAADADAADKKPPLPEPLEQKVSLLIQLLTIGAIPESLFILGRFPWIPEAFPEVLDRIHRILNFSIEKVYNDSRPRPTMPLECPTKFIPDFDQSGLPKGSLRLSRLNVRKTLRWPYPDKIDTNETQNYRFYWDEWSDNIPVCQTVDDLFTLCGTLLNISGVNIGKDEALLAKIASIGAKSLAEDKSEANLTRWHDLLKRLLLPALSHTKANASVVNAIWDLLKRYPITVRYALYAEWFEGQISRLPAMKSAFARATAETRSVMKRVSKSNTSEMAKQLAKTSYSSPGIVFRVAIEQLESYSNLIEAFVECAKYFTDLSYDVLVWSLMNSLGKSRSRTQAEHALTTSKWLTHLSQLAGKVFKRYSILDPSPVLKYVHDQLLKGNSVDLTILTEFISSMGGIVDAKDFTNQQILSMAGGEYLRRHTLIRGQDKRFESTKSSTRLIRALTESRVAAPLLINLAQYRQAAIYRIPEAEAPVKAQAKLIDDTHQVLVRYLDLLWSSMDSASFDSLVPSIPDLMRLYGLDIELAFMIGRGSLADRMFPWKPKKAEENKDKNFLSSPDADKDGDVSMSESKSSNIATDTPNQDSAAVEEQKPDDPSLIRATLQPIVDSVQETVRPEVWQKITPDLYVTFWALQLGDLFCPDKIYRQERERLKSEELALSRDRSDMSRRGQERKMEKRKELMQLQIGLSEECGEHLLRQAKWKFYLTKLFQSSFPEPKAKPDSISDTLLEQCFLPRALLSHADAEYTYKFIKALHEWNAPGFKLMSLCDRLFNANRLRSLIFSVTEHEAEYLGHFLKLVLEDLARWHKNDPVPNEKESKTSRDQPRAGAYEKEGKGPSDQPRLGFVLTVDESGKPMTFVEHNEFRDLLFRWHKNLNMAIKSCLGGSEWMHIRNAIQVLKGVVDFFPAVDFMGTQFLSQLEQIHSRESSAKASPFDEAGDRSDLATPATGAQSELKKRRGGWVMVQAFRPNAVGGSNADGDKSTLRATAPEFKHGTTKAQGGKTATTEEEDGEVQDGKDPRSNSHMRLDMSSTRDSLPTRPAGPRDSSKRDSTPHGPARSSTPMMGPGVGMNGPRSDNRPGLPERPPHTLPSRPDVPIPSHYASERYGHPRGNDRREARDPRDSRSRDPREPREPRDHREPRDARESRASESGRLERPQEYPDRRAPEIPRNPGQPDASSRRGAHDREQRDGRSGRLHEHGRLNESPAPPSSAQQPSSDAIEPPMNPERAALFAQKDGSDRPSRGHEAERPSRGRRQTVNDHNEAVNPERAALIDNTPTRPPRDETRDRSARAQSPRKTGRHGQETGPPEGPSDRHERPYPPEPRGSGREPRDRSPMGANARLDWPNDREGDRGVVPKGRDPSAFHPPPPRQDHASYQDQNYGRLNPIQNVNEIPSGPRGRGRGAARGGPAGPQGMKGRLDGRFGAPESERPPTPDRPPPLGPSAGRGRRGYEPNPGPTTPGSTPTGSHQDRMRGTGSTAAMPSPATPNPASGGVHPERLAQIGGSRPPPPPPPGPSPHGQGRQSMGNINTPDRPSGHGPRQAPNAYSPSPANDDAVPTGPSSSTERVRGGRRQLAGINSTLQQAQQNMPEPSRNTTSRRNQPRQMLGNSDVQVLTGGPPAVTLSQERQDPVRYDSSSRPQNGEDGSARNEPERGRRDRESRSNRTSRRNSRDREGERSQAREREGKEHREYRDRRSGAAAEGSRDGSERESRRSTRDQSNSGRGEPMGPPPGGRELMGGREGRHRGGGVGGREGEGDWNAGNSSGSGRGGHRGPRDGSSRPDERREGRDERGRKRRSEEGGVGGQANDREKRPRR